MRNIKKFFHSIIISFFKNTKKMGNICGGTTKPDKFDKPVQQKQTIKKEDDNS